MKVVPASHSCVADFPLLQIYHQATPAYRPSVLYQLAYSVWSNGHVAGFENQKTPSSKLALNRHKYHILQPRSYQSTKGRKVRMSEAPTGYNIAGDWCVNTFIRFQVPKFNHGELGNIGNPVNCLAFCIPIQASQRRVGLHFMRRFRKRYIVMYPQKTNHCIIGWNKGDKVRLHGAPSALS